MTIVLGEYGVVLRSCRILSMLSSTEHNRGNGALCNGCLPVVCVPSQLGDLLGTDVGASHCASVVRLCGLGAWYWGGLGSSTRSGWLGKV